MNREQFFDVFKPLIDRHPQHFTLGVNDEAYKIFQHLDTQEGIKVVAKLMLQSRYAPVENDIREAIRLIKDQRRAEVVPIRGPRPEPQSVFSDEERKELFEFVKKVARGQTTTEEREAMASAVQSAISVRRPCALCDEGLVFAQRKGETSTNCVFLCNCILGMRRMESYPRWGRDYEFNFQINQDGGGDVA